MSDISVLIQKITNHFQTTLLRLVLMHASLIETHTSPNVLVKIAWIAAIDPSVVFPSYLLKLLITYVVRALSQKFERADNVSS